jgi:hypothetical protein
LVTGFVSASTGSGKEPPYRERKCLVFSVERENVLDGSFMGGAAGVKNWFELEPVRVTAVSKDLWRRRHQINFLHGGNIAVLSRI